MTMSLNEFDSNMTAVIESERHGTRVRAAIRELCREEMDERHAAEQDAEKEVQVQPDRARIISPKGGVLEPGPFRAFGGAHHYQVGFESCHEIRALRKLSDTGRGAFRFDSVILIDDHPCRLRGDVVSIATDDRKTVVTVLGHTEPCESPQDSKTPFILRLERGKADRVARVSVEE